EGLEQGLEVQRHRPVMDVIEVGLVALLDGRVAAPAVDLSPAGDPRLDVVAQDVARHAPSELLDEARPFGPGPDEAHVATQDVEELGQLIEARPTQEDADSGSPRIVADRPARAGVRLRVQAHGAELQHPEAAAGDSHPLLALEVR